MSGLRAFRLEDVEASHGDTPGPYAEFLRRPGFSLGLYVLPKGGTDDQTPHDTDEVYVVVRGSGTLRVEDTETPVSVGSVLSVDRGREHSFVDIAEDLHVLVFFAPPEEPHD